MNEDLTKSNSLFSSVIDSMFTGILIVDTSGKIVFYNNKFIEMWRIPKNILASHDDKRALDFVGDQLKDPKSFFRKVKELYDNPEDESFDIVEFKDGRIFERYSRPQRIDHKTIGRVWDFHDITERMKMEMALRESEERYRSLAEAAHDMIFIIDNNDKIVYVNRFAAAHLGLKPEQVIGKRRSRIFPEQINKYQLPELRNVIDTGKARYVESVTRLMAKDMWLGTWLVPLRKDGVVNAVLGVSRDITARKIAEEALVAARDRLEAEVARRTNELNRTNAMLEKILANTHISIVYMDRDFKFIRVNKTYADIEGREPGYFIGKNHFDLYPHKDIKKIFRNAVKTGETYIAYAEPFIFPKHPESGMTYWDWSLSPVKDKDGKVEGLVCILIDATKRKLAEDDLLRSREELGQARRLSDIGILAITIAHELRNPLGVIRTAAYNAKRKSGNEALNVHLDRIENKIVEADSIINGLLSYGGIKMPRIEKADLRTLITEAITDARSRYNGRKVSVSVKYGNAKSLFIEADPIQLKEVFGNLLNNAYDAVSAKKGAGISVKVGLDRKSSLIHISFKDNGVGISPEEIHKISEPFFTTKSNGTGLGLPVCYQIVELHRGKISFKSKKGRGTEFTVTLPLKRIQ